MLLVSEILLCLVVTFYLLLACVPTVLFPSCVPVLLPRLIPPPRLSHISLVSTALFPVSLHLHPVPSLV